MAALGPEGMKAQGLSVEAARGFVQVKARGSKELNTRPCHVYSKVKCFSDDSESLTFCL